MPTHDILKAIDRLKSLAICIVESQEAINESAELDEPLFEISDKVQTARDLMASFALEFDAQQGQITRLMSEWHKGVFPEEYPEENENEIPVPVEHELMRA